MAVTSVLESLRLEGNDLFKKRDYAGAISVYTEAISIIVPPPLPPPTFPFPHSPPPGILKHKSTELAAPLALLLSNRSLAHTRINALYSAIEDAENAVFLDDGNERAKKNLVEALANLRANRGVMATEGAMELRDGAGAGGKGRGWFAARDIAEGEIILVERPVLECRVVGMAENTAEGRTKGIFREAESLLVGGEGNRNLDHRRALLNDVTMRLARMPLDRMLSQGPEQCWLTLRRAITENFHGWVATPSSGGAGLYALASLFNHSCDPNSLWTVDDINAQLVQRSTRRITKGEEITSTYLTVLSGLSPFERRASIRRDRNFDCLCDRCTTSDNDFKDRAHPDWRAVSIVCKECKDTGGVMLPTIDPRIEPYSDSRCSACGAIVSAEDARRLTQEARELYEKMICQPIERKEWVKVAHGCIEVESWFKQNLGPQHHLWEPANAAAITLSKALQT